MSEETASPENTSPAETPAPRVRRISNPRPRKTKAAAAEESAPAVEAAPAEAAAAPAPAPREEAEEIPQPVMGEPMVVSDPPLAEFVESSPQGSGDWPEAETVSSGGSDAKRKRRRKKKGKKDSQGGFEEAAPVPSAPAAGQSQPQNPAQPRPQQQQPPQPQAPRAPLNSGVLARKAWKIFLAEVSEEGVSLIGDHEARDLSRRCFRLAELFMEEEARRSR